MAYTYLVKSKITNKVYYGVRWGDKTKPENDLWSKYFTSSKHIKQQIKEFGKESFIFEIRKVFANKQEAIQWEETVLRRMKVLQKPEVWINKCINKAIRYDKHPRQGAIVSEETRKKISSSNKGKARFTDSQKEQMSVDRSGSKHWNYGRKWSEEAKQKNRESNIKRRKENPELFTNPPSGKGRKHSEESKLKQSLVRKLYWERKKASSPS
jgi:hypothetical protein